MKKVQDSGSVEFRGIKFGIGRSYAGHRVCVMDAGKVVMIFDLTGTLIIEHPWPKPGTTYVSNRQPRVSVSVSRTHQGNPSGTHFGLVGVLRAI